MDFTINYWLVRYSKCTIFCLQNKNKNKQKTNRTCYAPGDSIQNERENAKECVKRIPKHDKSINLMLHTFRTYIVHTIKCSN